MNNNLGKNLTDYKKEFDKLYVEQFEDLVLTERLNAPDKTKTSVYKLLFDIAIYQILISVGNGNQPQTTPAKIIIASDEAIQPNVSQFVSTKHTFGIWTIQGQNPVNDTISYELNPVILKKKNTLLVKIDCPDNASSIDFNIIVKYKKIYE